MNKSDCIFCKIAKGEIPSVKVWESENSFAFLDMNPINRGHTLVIPKKHEDYLFDMNWNEYQKLMIDVKIIAELLKEKLNPKRIGVIIEGFGVAHAHIHLIPINGPHDFGLEHVKHTQDKDLEKVAEEIKRNLKK